MTAASPRVDAEGTPAIQTYRIELCLDFTGTHEQARAEARRAAALVDGEVTAIFDEDWNECVEILEIEPADEAPDEG